MTVALPTSDEPRASILILSRRDPEMLRTCLQAVRRSIDGTVDGEVLVLLNGADEDVIAFCEHDVTGAKVERSDENLGFPGGTNLLAARARGEFLVMLNDDTEVEPGWLPSLVATADEHPEAGAVGSRILFPDGSVQEAGGVIWSDGTTAHVGRGSRTRAFHLYIRPVDYCSAASLLVRRSVWDRVGGLDEDFFPGYYEDVDLCLAIRELGGQVLYEPRSRLIHHESSTSSDDVKAAAAPRNRRRLQAKWPAQLAQHEPPGAASPERVERASLRTRGWPRRILFVAERLPDVTAAGNGDGLLRAIRDLQSIPAAVTVFAPESPEDDPEPVGRTGVDILHRDLLGHLAAPDVFYDGIFLWTQQGALAEIQRLQPVSAVIRDARDMREPARPGVWIDLLAQARARRIDEYV